MSNGADPLRIIGGLLLILFGVCLVSAGGLCTFFMVGDLRVALSDGGVVLIIALAILGLGVLSVAAGVKCLMPPRRD